ncbi:MAG: putative LPS assembly protein LptD, partial [Dysgonamonadaceae bacterium]|nr:putative LPS assembly protein LptD [Dysgonamonadaceae bacterium]
KEFGHPIFDDKGTQYEMKNVRYNFKTEKAFIKNVVTEQGEGYIVANEAKKNDDNSFYMVNAKYTTCDEHTHPHFYLNLSKAKVRPGQDVVTGPAWLVVADVPLFPLVLPFAFFPFNETYSSGIIMPSYGDEMERGFYLHNGGYYFAISDYIDLALTGEIYTKGTWGAGVRSNYQERYKYRGNVNAYYMKTILGDKGMPDYSASTDFRLSWTHSQDPKANMYRTLSASVNYSTSSYNQRNLNSRYNRQATNNTKSSSVNITQRFPNSPWNLSASASVNQVSRDSTISATLPNLSASMSRIYPFKRKDAIGEERWYEKITMSYSGEFRNSINTKENKFLESNIIKDWQNGMNHRIPISATFSLFDYINISPSFNYNERWYTGKEMQEWDPVSKRHVTSDTIYGFNRVYDFNTSISANTKLYGMYVPWKMFGDKVQAIRHVFSPSISFSYSPDFGAPAFNFYETYSYRNEYGEDVDYTYSPYSRMMFGAPSQGKQGNIGFDFKNNVEMKIRSESDTTGFKKVSLIDDLGINFSHNLMADSMKWSMIYTNMRLKLSKSYTLSLNATWDPYLYEVNENGRPIHVDKLRVLNGKGFGKLYSTGTSFSYSINPDTFSRLFAKKGDKDKKDDEELPEDEIDDGSLGTEPEFEEAGREMKSKFQQESDTGGEFDEYGYRRPGVNWNLSFNYSLRYGYGDFNTEKLEYDGKLTHSLGISGSLQPTQNWNFTFNTDYNFDLNRFTYVNCTLTRELHCWSMSASFIPIGPYKSYNFIISANSSLLQDLKYEQRSSQYENMNWY